MVSMRYGRTHEDVLDKGDGTDSSLYGGHGGQLAVYQDARENFNMENFSSLTSILEAWVTVYGVQGVSPISSRRTSNSANLTAIVAIFRVEVKLGERR